MKQTLLPFIKITLRTKLIYYGKQIIESAFISMLIYFFWKLKIPDATILICTAITFVHLQVLFVDGYSRVKSAFMERQDFEEEVCYK
jgi:hypothetical protein